MSQTNNNALTTRAGWLFPMSLRMALALCVISVALGSSSARAAAQNPSIQKYLASGITVSSASKEQLGDAVGKMIASDPKNAPVNISETLAMVPEDRARIDAILTSAVRYLKQQDPAAIPPATSSGSTGKAVVESKGVVVSTPSAFDCTLVLDIWSMAVGAVPAMDQWIMEIGMREAPECFLGVITESVTETGTVFRQFNTGSGLNRSQNNSNRSSRSSASSGNGNLTADTGGGAVPSNEQ